MSELSIINQKAGPLGEKNFGNSGVGNEIKSVGNSNSMGLDDDITGQPCLKKQTPKMKSPAKSLLFRSPTQSALPSMSI